MSKGHSVVELQEAEVTQQVETPEAPQTAGSLLREARETAGMHVSTLAEVLKVPVAKLQALEANDWQRLPDAVFTRSLALGVCKALQMDATPVMALLPKASAGGKFTAPGPGINEPFRDKAVRSVHDNPNSNAIWKWLSLAVLAGVGGGIWYFAQQQEVRDAVVASVQERSDRAMGTSSAVQSADAAHPVSMPAPLPVTADAPPAPAVSAASDIATSSVQSTQAATASPVAPAEAVSVPAPAAAMPAPAVAAPEMVPATPAIADATLRIQAKAPTWIQVRIPGGKVLEQKTLNQGDFFETQAPKPLAVVIGRADAAEVQVGGAAFDLALVARENVARFEVK